MACMPCWEPLCVQGCIASQDHFEPWRSHRMPNWEPLCIVRVHCRSGATFSLGICAGDRLNFGMAAEEAKARGLKVRGPPPLHAQLAADEAEALSAPNCAGLASWLGGGAGWLIKDGRNAGGAAVWASAAARRAARHDQQLQPCQRGPAAVAQRCMVLQRCSWPGTTWHARCSADSLSPRRSSRCP